MDSDVSPLKRPRMIVVDKAMQPKHAANERPNEMLTGKEGSINTTPERNPSGLDTGRRFPINAFSYAVSEGTSTQNYHRHRLSGFCTLLQKNSSCFRIPKCKSSQSSHPNKIMAKQHSPRFLAIANETKARIHECTIHELKTRMDQGENVTLVDVREDSEFTAGHIPGAIHLSKGIIERDIESVVPDPNQEILLYCGGGFRSALAADNLQRMGYRNVVSVDGGWRSWSEAHYPIEIK